MKEIIIENELKRMFELIKYSTTKTLNENLITERDAVIGSESDLDTVASLLGVKKITGTVPGVDIKNIEHVVYTEKGTEGNSFYFFRYKPGGYWNRNNFVIIINPNGSKTFGTFDTKNMYLKGQNTPQNLWFKDKGFDKVWSLGNMPGLKSKSSSNNTELRQSNINNTYCSVRNNIITYGNYWNKKPWDEYVKTYNLTLDEIEAAKKACANQPVTEYPNQPTKTGTKTGTSTKTKTVAAPPEFLKNTEGVKAFQDWLDTNKKGWYKGGELNKGGGYGSFGPSTTRAWNTHQNAYIESKNLKKVGGVERTGSLTPSNIGTPSITSRPAPNLQPNVTGDQIYKSLYDNGNLEGAGNNRIKVKSGIPIADESLLKLDQYLSTLGYNRIKQETEKTYGSKYVWSK